MNKVRGVAMVELAIVLPILLVLFLGITELGRALLFQHRLTHSAEAGARYAARAFGAVADDCSTTAAWPTAVTNARQLAAFGQLGSADPVVPGLDADAVEVEIVVRDVTDAGTTCIVAVTVTVQYEGIFGSDLIPLLDLPQPLLSARSEERYVGE